MEYKSESKRLENAFDDLLERNGLPAPEKEYVFHPTRRWRFDRAYPDLKIAIELEGGLYGALVRCHNCGTIVRKRISGGRLVTVRQPGRHTTGTGAEKDMEKYNEAAVLGWTVLRFGAKMIHMEDALDYVKRAIAYREDPKRDKLSRDC